MERIETGEPQDAFIEGESKTMAIKRLRLGECDECDGECCRAGE